MNTQTNIIKKNPPSASSEFDKIYASAFAHWVWSDIRIPHELKALVSDEQPKYTLELGCGVGRFSAYMAAQGIAATAVDFSAVAIQRAKKRIEKEIFKPRFIVGDVTNLDMLDKLFDVSFDVGCFHCLDKDAQQKYVREVYRLLKPGGTHLIWALDHSPADIRLSPAYIADTFDSHFELAKEKFSRRRIIASHWYWLKKSEQ
ncbi:MAG: class I SAM-dependent methyltransferase [Agriterribacter sp.]